MIAQGNARSTLRPAEFSQISTLSEDRSNPLPESVFFTTMKTIEELQASLQKILDINGYKKGSKIARTAECAFIQGLMIADERYAKNNYLVICLMAGRSILDP